MTYPYLPAATAYPQAGYSQPGSPECVPSGTPHMPIAAPGGTPVHPAYTPNAHDGWTAAAASLALGGVQTYGRYGVGHPALYLLAIVGGIGIVLVGVFVALAL